MGIHMTVMLRSSKMSGAVPTLKTCKSLPRYLETHLGLISLGNNAVYEASGFASCVWVVQYQVHVRGFCR